MACYIGPPTWYLRTAGGQMTGNITFAGAQTVDGRDISAMVRAKIKVGSYVGNSADDRNINIGLDLTAKTNVHIWIGGDGAWLPALRPELGQGDMTKPGGAGAFAVNYVQALTATGFQIGVQPSVNQDTNTYWYVVIYEEP